MRETMHAREMTLATAQGDPGLWEMIKVMLFTFAGSTHSKYTQYLLEMTTDLECSPALRMTLLRTTLANLKGYDGWQVILFRNTSTDRSKLWYSERVWSMVTNSSVHVGCLKLEWLEGVGLRERSVMHTGAAKKGGYQITSGTLQRHRTA